MAKLPGRSGDEGYATGSIVRYEAPRRQNIREVRPAIRSTQDVSHHYAQAEINAAGAPFQLAGSIADAVGVYQKIDYAEQDSRMKAEFAQLTGDSTKYAVELMNNGPSVNPQTGQPYYESYEKDFDKFVEDRVNQVIASKQFKNADVVADWQLKVAGLKNSLSLKLFEDASSKKLKVAADKGKFAFESAPNIGMKKEIAAGLVETGVINKPTADSWIFAAEQVQLYKNSTVTAQQPLSPEAHTELLTKVDVAVADNRLTPEQGAKIHGERITAMAGQAAEAVMDAYEQGGLTAAQDKYEELVLKDYQEWNVNLEDVKTIRNGAGSGLETVNKLVRNQDAQAAKSSWKENFVNVATDEFLAETQTQGEVDKISAGYHETHDLGAMSDEDFLSGQSPISRGTPYGDGHLLMLKTEKAAPEFAVRERRILEQGSDADAYNVLVGLNDKIKGGVRGLADHYDPWMFHAAAIVNAIGVDGMPEDAMAILRAGANKTTEDYKTQLENANKLLESSSITKHPVNEGMNKAYKDLNRPQRPFPKGSLEHKDATELFYSMHALYGELNGVTTPASALWSITAQEYDRQNPREQPGVGNIGDTLDVYNLSEDGAGISERTTSIWHTAPENLQNWGTPNYAPGDNDNDDLNEWLRDDFGGILKIGTMDELLRNDKARSILHTLVTIDGREAPEVLIDKLENILNEGQEGDRVDALETLDMLARKQGVDRLNGLDSDTAAILDYFNTFKGNLAILDPFNNGDIEGFIERFLEYDKGTTATERQRNRQRASGALDENTGGVNIIDRYEAGSAALQQPPRELTGDQASDAEWFWVTQAEIWGLDPNVEGSLPFPTARLDAMTAEYINAKYFTSDDWSYTNTPFGIGQSDRIVGPYSPEAIYGDTYDHAFGREQKRRILRKENGKRKEGEAKLTMQGAYFMHAGYQINGVDMFFVMDSTGHVARDGKFLVEPIRGDNPIKTQRQEQANWEKSANQIVERVKEQMASVGWVAPWDTDRGWYDEAASRMTGDERRWVELSGNTRIVRPHVPAEIAPYRVSREDMKMQNHFYQMMHSRVVSTFKIYIDNPHIDERERKSRRSEVDMWAHIYLDTIGHTRFNEDGARIPVPGR